MSNRIEKASWILAIITIILCDVLLAVTFAVGIFGDTEGVDASLLDAILPVVGWIVPLLQLACIVFGIMAAVNKAQDTIITTRAIMLTFKLGLIPFFIVGGILEGALIFIGMHPALAPLVWSMAIFIAGIGWITMFTGSMWAIATVVQLRRSGQITGGQAALHIILQLIFVVDVIDAIVLFVRSYEQVGRL